MESPTTECHVPDFRFQHLVVGDPTLGSHFSFFLLGLWVPTKFHVHIFIDLFDQECIPTLHIFGSQVSAFDTRHLVALPHCSHTPHFRHSVLGGLPPPPKYQLFPHPPHLTEASPPHHNSSSFNYK
jgi:hypothetical protein